MPITREVKIIKVPLSDKERLPDYPKAFPKMPRLYLELLENKAKIKQDLINKEYVPAIDSNPNRDTNDYQQPHGQPEDSNHPDRKDKRSYSTDDSRSHSTDNDDYSDTESDRSSDSDSNRYSDSRSDRSSPVSRNKDFTDDETNPIQDRSKKPYADDTEINERDYSESNSSRSQDTASSMDSRNSRRESNYSYSGNKSNDSDALSERLQELLGDSDSEGSRSKGSKTDKYSRPPKMSHPHQTSKYTPYDKYKEMKIDPPLQPPPTLAELQAKGHYQPKLELRDVNYVGMSEYEEEDKKREIIFKFDLLKKSYPLAAHTIPEYTIHSDYRDMQKSYDATVRRLSLDSSVDSYKTYLTGGFMLVEFVFGNFLGFDMQGFTQQQLVSMSSYEKLLIELGEKSYVPSGSKWPVEMRLLFLIIMNAGFFIVSKMIMKKTGANIMSMVNNLSAPAQPSNLRPKRRMKGPNINIDDIPDMQEENAKTN